LELQVKTPQRRLRGNYESNTNMGRKLTPAREQNGLLQKKVALTLGIGHTNYNKMKKDNREPSVTELQQLAELFDMSVDDILNYEGEAIPKEVTLENKAWFEQINLINQLDEDDKVTVFKIIDTMLTKKKFKDFFNKNIAAL
jgi:transcriptional regulator with XRE-family HTH domain